ncbi:unnamed protein product, partial [marine sediment metagenome]
RNIRQRENEVRRMPKSPNDVHPVDVKIGHDRSKANRAKPKVTRRRNDGH